MHAIDPQNHPEQNAEEKETGELAEERPVSIGFPAEPTEQPYRDGELYPDRSQSSKVA